MESIWSKTSDRVKRPLLDSDIQSAIGTTKFYYTLGNGDWSVGTLERSIFGLSLTELGKSPSFSNTEGSTLPIAASLQNAKQWTRSPGTSGNTIAFETAVNGVPDRIYCSANSGARPVFTLSAGTTYVLDNGTVSTTPPAPSTLTVPQMAMQGNQITVSWSAVDGADGYILERKANTDSDWTQVYSGANTSFSETVGTWTSVQYRVKAGVSGTYGDYTTSASVPVVSASAVVISGTDGDLGTLVNDVTYTVSSDGTNPLTVVETINGMETMT